MHFFQEYGSQKDDLYHLFELNGESFPSHFHRSYEIFWVKKGTALAFIDGQEYVLTKGMGVFVFSNQVHSFEAKPGTRLGVLIFAPEVVPDFHSRHQKELPLQHCIPIAPGLNDLEANTSLWRIKSHLYECCARVEEATSFDPTPLSSNEDLLQQMIRWVLEHYQENGRLQTLANEFAYDYKYLSRIFKQGTGMGFNRYLNHVRILKAQELLETTDWSVQTIATHCGYENIRSFHRNYRSLMGKAPRATNEQPK